MMLEELQRRNYAKTTIDCYLRGVEDFSRHDVRNVNSAWGACTPAPLPGSRRSTHFKPLGILKSPHATTACGAPSRSSDLNGQGRPPLQGGEGDPRPSIRCDREWERFKRIKRRIISCAQLGSRTFERTRTNQEVYYQPTGAKTQRHARVASAHTSSVTRMQIMVLRR